MDEKMVEGLFRVLKVLHTLEGGEAEVADGFLLLTYPDGSTIALTVEEDEVSRITLPVYHRRFQKAAPEAKWVLLCRSRVDERLKQFASLRGIKLVGLDEIYRDIGEKVVEVLSAGRTFGDLALVESPPDEVVVEEIEEEIDGEGDADIIPIFVEEGEEMGTEKYVKCRVGEGEVKLLGSREVGGTRAKLIYVPFHVFEYSAEVYTEGEILPRTARGYVGVNASLDPERAEDVAQEWKYGMEATSTRPPKSEVLKTRMEVEDAEKKAKEHLLRALAREKEITRETKEVVIIERKREYPEERSIRLNYVGLYHLPLWRVSGRKGTILVDGITGEVLTRR